MSISNYAELEILDHALGTGAWTMPTQIYVLPHTASPGEACSNAPVSITRQAASFGAAASGATTNTSAVTFTSMPTASVTHISLWDAVSGSNPIWYGALSSAVSCNSGDTFEIAAGSLTVSLD